MLPQTKRIPIEISRLRKRQPMKFLGLNSCRHRTPARSVTFHCHSNNGCGAALRVSEIEQTSSETPVPFGSEVPSESNATVILAKAGHSEDRITLNNRLFATYGLQVTMGFGNL